MSKGKSKTSVVAMMAVLASLLLPVLAATPAQAAGEPDHVTNDLVICKAGSISTEYIANPDGQGFICSTLPQSDQDTKDFYSGNAGKGWNEFDLVPQRLTMSAGNAAPATQSYTFAVALDGSDNGELGYDRITEPSKNTVLSDANSGTITFGPTLTKTPGFGGMDTTIYRLVTVTGQAKSTDLVIDFDGRLAIGSHLFSGASLHTNFANQALTQTGQDRSIQTGEIAPQSISKDLSAVQNVDTNWDITKEATPANLEFGNVCNTGTSELSTTVDVTVNWDNLGSVPSDKVEVTTHVYATNPSHRSITVNVSDTVSSGGSPLYTVTDNGNVVDANTANALILSDTREIDASSVVGGALSNVATAAYFDTIFQEPVPGNTTATANATVQQGTVSNASVDITDSESIIGTGLKFSVADPSVGGFTGGYTAGTKTTGPVGWELDDVTADGSVTFNKTVYLAANTGATTGTLSDTADLNGDSISKPASLDVGITSSASGSVTIAKTTTVPVDVPTDFVFDVQDSSDTSVGTITVSFDTGDSSGSGSLGGLDLGDYTLIETDADGFTAAPDTPFSITLGDCDVTVPIENTFGLASAAAQKVTVPEGNEAGWTLTLYKDDGDGIQEPGADDAVYATAVTDASGLADFGTIADEGDYFILETDGPSGFVQGAGVGTECSFTVDYPADADRVFSDCKFTNTEKATADVVKVTDPSGYESGWEFTLYLDDDGTPGAGTPNNDTVVGTATTTGAGAVTFQDNGTDVALDEGNYYVLETPQAGWESSSTCEFSITFPADAGTTVHCSFTNTAKGSIGISKTGGTTGQVFVFELRQGAAPLTTPGTLLDTENVTSGGATVKFKISGSTDLPFGNYNICEIMQVGWSNDMPNQYNLALPDNEIRVCTDVSITVANQDLTLSVVNTPPPGGERGTLGYWKNHSSCKTSNGKQAFILDQTLALFPIASGQTTHGFFVGDLYVDTCTEAYRLLDKTSVTNANKKYASDPAFTFAAQYVAAVLNIKAGATPCAPTVPDAINQGQALLDLLNFNGIAPPTYAPGAVGAQQKTTLLQLAATLDTYNNGGIC